MKKINVDNTPLKRQFKVSFFQKEMENFDLKDKAIRNRLSVMLLSFIKELSKYAFLGATPAGDTGLSIREWIFKAKKIKVVAGDEDTIYFIEIPDVPEIIVFIEDTLKRMKDRTVIQDYQYYGEKDVFIAKELNLNANWLTGKEEEMFIKEPEIVYALKGQGKTLSYIADELNIGNPLNIHIGANAKIDEDKEIIEELENLKKKENKKSFWSKIKSFFKINKRGE